MYVQYTLALNFYRYKTFVFKSDTFENYKSFVPVEVQSHSYDMVGLVCNVEHPQYLV